MRHFETFRTEQELLARLDQLKNTGYEKREFEVYTRNKFSDDVEDFYDIDRHDGDPSVTDKIAAFFSSDDAEDKMFDDLDWDEHTRNEARRHIDNGDYLLVVNREGYYEDDDIFAYLDEENRRVDGVRQDGDVRPDYSYRGQNQDKEHIRYEEETYGEGVRREHPEDERTIGEKIEDVFTEDDNHRERETYRQHEGYEHEDDRSLGEKVEDFFTDDDEEPTHDGFRRSDDYRHEDDYKHDDERFPRDRQVVDGVGRTDHIGVNHVDPVMQDPRTLDPTLGGDLEEDPRANDPFRRDPEDLDKH